MIHKEIAGMQITGFSLAGEETVIVLPEFNVCFDVGRAPREVIAIDNVCLSHGHMDHAAGVAYYFSQRTFVGLGPGRMIVHRGLAGYFQQLMGIWADIERHPSPGQVVGVEPLEDVTIRRGMVVRPFEVDHSACALGFTLIEQRHKLKTQFQGKSGPELVALKKQGIEIEARVEVPLVTYSGDTAVASFLDYDFVRKSKAVLLECTFLEREHMSRARSGRHVHVNDLPRILADIPDAQILLTHVTRRTDMRLAKQILDRVIDDRDKPRVSFLMDRPPRMDRRRPAPPASVGFESATQG